MIRWFILLGAFLVWAAHFAGLYTLASAADVWSSSDSAASRWIGLIFTLACLLAIGGIGLMIVRRRRNSEVARWELKVGAMAILIAALAILWQAIPLAF